MSAVMTTPGHEAADDVLLTASADGQAQLLTPGALEFLSGLHSRF